LVIRAPLNHTTPKEGMVKDKQLIFAGSGFNGRGAGMIDGAVNEACHGAITLIDHKHQDQIG
jgi:hypothetical protein